MKSKSIFTVLCLVAAAVFLAGCASNTPPPDISAPIPSPSAPPLPVASPSEMPSPSPAVGGAEQPDVVSGPTRANDEAEFEQKVSKANTEFMVIASRDMTFTKDITVESGIKSNAANRALAFGTYKEDKTVDKRFTLAVPRLIIAGDNVKFEYGIIKGDVYVTGAGFNIKDATIDGNLYFASEALKSAFTIDEKSKVTGNTEVKAL